MRSPGRRAVLLALAGSGLLWGTTVPLTKLALAAGWGPAWLTVARFALAVAPLAWCARHRLRDALTPAVAGMGVLGYGVAIVLQNAGIARTSVSHAALLLGAMPVAVALLVVTAERVRVSQAGTASAGRAGESRAATAASAGRAGESRAATATSTGRAGDSRAGKDRAGGAAPPAVPAALDKRNRVSRAGWVGLLLATAGVGLVSADGGGAATLSGDALVLLSVLPAAVFFAGQPKLLAGRDPLAVTAVQLGAAAVATTPYAVWTEGAPPAAVPAAALVGLAIGGTLVPYALFAWAQQRVSPVVAGAYLNLEPLVAVALGAAAFGDPMSVAQVTGGAAVLAGIALTGSLPTRRRARPHRAAPRRPWVETGPEPRRPGIRAGFARGRARTSGSPKAAPNPAAPQKAAPKPAAPQKAAPKTDAPTTATPKAAVLKSAAPRSAAVRSAGLRSA